MIKRYINLPVPGVSFGFHFFLVKLPQACKTDLFCAGDEA
jgi:hypothetical protein